jgi:catechol 2,3-dioxygenase-like lactoylglutathione lyase family enzyme
VRDLAACERFYEAAFAALGHSKLVVRPGTIGFGKKYPEFWLNERRTMTPADPDSGTHIGLRAPNIEAVQAFHAAALRSGGTSDGEPGPRPGEIGGYYAAFIRDPEGNKIEAATFTATPRD